MDHSASDPPARSPEPASDVRSLVADFLARHSRSLARDVADILPLDELASMDPDEKRQAGSLLLDLFVAVIRDERAAVNAGAAAPIRRLLAQRGIGAERIFVYAYLIERAALDELSLDRRLGLSSEAWTGASQILRRASFDVLSAIAASPSSATGSASIVDDLTTLHTRPVFEAALSKELIRAGRSHQSLAIILVDLDHLATINERFGFAVGDKVLERAGILVRNFFRQHDWMARYGDDGLAVLVANSDLESATALADRVRQAVEDRLSFPDHLTGEVVRVTVSIGVVSVAPDDRSPVDPDRLVTAVEEAVRRAKKLGRNRVESARLTDG